MSIKNIFTSENFEKYLRDFTCYDFVTIINISQFSYSVYRTEQRAIS